MDASAFTRPGIAGLLFGRERELAFLNSLVDRLPDQGAALLMRGEAGIGKSILLSAAVRRAEEAGTRVLRTTGVQSEAELPFAGLHQLLLPLFSGLGELPSRQREALLAAFGMAEMSDAPDRFLIGLAVLELLSDAAEPAPILVVTDDAQWLDSATADILAFVARRIEHEPLVLLLAIRNGETDPFAEVGLPELTLGGLDTAAAEALLVAHGRDLAPEVRGQLLVEAAGNPLALVELPVPLSGNQLAGEVPLPILLPLTMRLERAFTAKVGTLPTSTQALLQLAAANSEGVLSEILEAARVMRGGNSKVEDIAPAVSAGLVQLDGNGLRFRHPLVRSAIYQSASLTDRRAAHAALAEVLSKQPDRQVWHRAAALVGPDESVAGALEEAAERAQHCGAVSTAVRALERAVGLSQDGQQRGRRLLQAAEIAFEASRHKVARRFLKEAQRLSLTATERQRVLQIRQQFSEEIPSGDTGIRSFVKTAEGVSQSGDLATAANLLLHAAFRCLWVSAGVEVRERILSASTKLNLERDDPRLVLIRACAAPVRYGAEIIEILSGMPPDSGGDGEAAGILGLAASVVGDFELADSFFSASVNALREQGRITLLASSLGERAHAYWFLDRWDVAVSDAEEGRWLAEETGQPVWAAGAAAFDCQLAAVRGDVERVEGLSQKVEGFAVPHGVSIYLCRVQWARGLAALGDGRAEEAYSHMIRTFRSDDPAWHYSQRYFMIGDLAEAAYHAGRLDEVRALLVETEAAVAEMTSPAGRVAVEYARAILADEEDAETRFEQALDAVRSHRPFVRARLQLAYGTWLRRGRRVVESRAPLRAAKEGFDALGAAAWAERARQELRASGVGSRPRERNAFEDLTPQELQIARLAASGLSNREIGERLFLSHRTVGVHLYRAFPKLGVSSRGQLGSVLDDALQ